MKKYILAIALIAAVATTIHLSLKKPNINPEDLMAAAVARPEAKTQAPTDVKEGEAGAEGEKEQSSKEWQPGGWSKGCIKKQACNYVGDEAMKQTPQPKQDHQCVYQTALAKVDPKGSLKDIKKVMWPTKPELENPVFCNQGEKDCVPLYEMQVVETYKNPNQVANIASVYKIVGHVNKKDLATYDGARVCKWESFKEQVDNPGGELYKTLKIFENGQDVTVPKLGGPNSKDKAVNNRK